MYKEKPNQNSKSGNIIGIGFGIFFIVLGTLMIIRALTNPTIHCGHNAGLIITAISGFVMAIAGFILMIVTCSSISRNKAVRQRNPEEQIYIYQYCPQCGQKLRLQKGNGQILITCPKCHSEFNSQT